MFVEETSTTTRSCRDPGTAVIQFWLLGSDRRRPQCYVRRQRWQTQKQTQRRRCCYGRAPPLTLLVLLYSQFGDCELHTGYRTVKTVP